MTLEVVGEWRIRKYRGKALSTKAGLHLHVLIPEHPQRAGANLPLSLLLLGLLTPG